MPKSKRDKKISLTKTSKKGKALKEKVVDDVKSCVEKFKSVYVFTHKNLRTEAMQDVRREWKPSRFFFGKNKVIAFGLGRTPEEEVEEGIHKLTKYLKGRCGLLFTDCEKQEVVDWFNDFEVDSHPRSGFVVNSTITLPEGPLKQFAHTMEPYLRKLGLPTKLDRGVITLIKEYEVCKEGSVLNPEQAKILELLDYKLAKFKLTLKCCYIKGKGFEKFKYVNEMDQEMEENEEEEDNE